MNKSDQNVTITDFFLTRLEVSRYVHIKIKKLKIIFSKAVS